LAHFTKQQLQDKEKDLKGSYKAISGAEIESSVGWNESMGMIIADPAQWENCMTVSYLFAFHKVILFKYIFVLTKVYVVFNINIQK
jgi:hypothetical protein